MFVTSAGFIMGHDVGGRGAPPPLQGSISIDSAPRVPLRSTLGYIPAAASRLKARRTVSGVTRRIAKVRAIIK